MNMRFESEIKGFSIKADNEFLYLSLPSYNFEIKLAFADINNAKNLIQQMVNSKKIE